MPRIELTDRFVAAAKRGAAAQTDYFDSLKDSRGLALRVSATHKAWTFTFTSPKDGKRARMNLGSYPAQPLAKARGLAIEARLQVEEGKDPRDSAKTSDLTVAGLVESYLQKYARPNLRSAAKMEARFDANVIPIIGTIKIAELHRRDVNRVLDAILARQKPTMARIVFQDMRAMLRWAVAERGDLDRNPMEGMSSPSSEEPRERVLTNEEMAVLWKGLPVSLAKSKACQRIIKLCLITAQRVGEVSGMRLDELDMAKGIWALPGSRTKNGHPHTIPLSDMAIDLIKESIEAAGKSPFVFPAGDESLPPMAVARTIGRAQEATEARPGGRFGIAHFTAHDLRRTALTGMAGLGVAPVVLGYVANHRTLTNGGITMAVYNQYDYAKEKRQALDLWADRLQSIIEGQGAKIIPMKAHL